MFDSASEGSVSTRCRCYAARRPLGVAGPTETDLSSTGSSPCKMRDGSSATVRSELPGQSTRWCGTGAPVHSRDCTRQAGAARSAWRYRAAVDSTKPERDVSACDLVRQRHELSGHARCAAQQPVGEPLRFLATAAQHTPIVDAVQFRDPSGSANYPNRCYRCPCHGASSAEATSRYTQPYAAVSLNTMSSALWDGHCRRTLC